MAPRRIEALEKRVMMTKKSKLIAGGVGLLSAAALVLGAGLPAAQATVRSCGVSSSGKVQYVVMSSKSFTTTAGGSIVHVYERTRDGAIQSKGFNYAGSQPGVHYESSSSSFQAANAFAQGRNGTSVDSQSVACG